MVTMRKTHDAAFKAKSRSRRPRKVGNIFDYSWSRGAGVYRLLAAAEGFLVRI